MYTYSMPGNDVFKKLENVHHLSKMINHIFVVSKVYPTNKKV